MQGTPPLASRESRKPYAVTNHIISIPSGIAGHHNYELCIMHYEFKKQRHGYYIP